MTEVWYSRRPEVAEMAQRVTMKRVATYLRMADELPRTVLEPGTDIPLVDILASVAHELEIRLAGGNVIMLAPAEPCPDPTRCFEI